MEHELNSWIFIVYYYSTQHNEFIHVKKDQANKEKYDWIKGMATVELQGQKNSTDNRTSVF